MLTPVGIGFAGYRSYGSDRLARVAPLGKINLLAGQNNAGKSNALRAIHSISGSAEGQNDVDTRGAWDKPAWEEEAYPRFEIAYDFEEVVATATAAHQNLAEPVVRATLATLRQDDSTLWFEVETLQGGGQGDLSKPWIRTFVEGANNSTMQAVAHLARNWLNSYHDSWQYDVQPVLTALYRLLPPVPPVRTIAAFREISDNGNPRRTELTGGNIMRSLLQLQSPKSEQLEDKKKFRAIERFVQQVMSDPHLTIEVPWDPTTIHVTQNGYTLPIENYGTGIHEVVILAAAATIVNESIVCVEEPEVHLHPLLQRKLLRYLAEETTNTYVIATHSAHLLDSSRGTIFHVQQHDGRSSISFAGTAAQHSAICADLGYRPSDLVQCNAILWVEGPSDRIYLNWWLQHVAPGSFIEGIHYSIMFYGGSLLKGLSALDAAEVTGFISLRNLNRYTMVMIDSDKTGSNSKLSEPKLRVIDELGRDSETGLAWLTHGYTVENYVPWQDLSAAILVAHPKARPRAVQPSRYENPLSERLAGAIRPSKVAIATAVTASPPTALPYDLAERLAEVITLIEKANGL